jgi:hypothetical protein
MPAAPLGINQPLALSTHVTTDERTYPNAYDRREFMRRGLRYLCLGVWLLLATVLLRRTLGNVSGCVKQSACDRCPWLAQCGLPQAIALKQDHPHK